MATKYASDDWYADEKRTYRAAYDLYIRDEDVTIILKKICRHFRMKVPIYKFWGHRDSGSAGWRGITIGHNPSMGLLIHEVGHLAKSDSPVMRRLLAKVVNRGTSHHGSRYSATLNHIHLFAKSKLYWRKQLKQRRIRNEEKTAAMVIAEVKEKLPKAPEDKIELKKKDIEKIELKMERYNKRLQYFTRLYGTKLKKANRSLAAHKRSLKKMVDIAAG